MEVERNHYETLDIKFPSSSIDITLAYRRMAMKWHPDRHADCDKKKAEVVFKEVQSAYEVLGNEIKRLSYDKLLKKSKEENKYVDSGNEYSFNQSKNNSQKVKSKSTVDSRSKRGDDIFVIAEISVFQAMAGCDYKVKSSIGRECSSCFGCGGNRFRCSGCHGTGKHGSREASMECGQCGGSGFRMINCDVCGGTGKTPESTEKVVKIPPGVVDGSRIRAAGLGKPGAFGGDPGDLMITLRIDVVDEWKFDGEDFHGFIELSVITAILGGNVEFYSPTGALLQIKIPQGTDSTKSIRLSKMGLLNNATKRQGDIILKPRIIFPRMKKVITDDETITFKNLFLGS